MDTNKMNVIAGVIVQSGDKVLMCKRAERQSYGGKWSVPSGHANDMESPINACRREFYEETNHKLTGSLQLIDLIKPSTGDIMYIYYTNSPKEIIPDLENAKDGEEHTECGYFSYDELPFGDDEDDLYKIIRRVLRR